MAVSYKKFYNKEKNIVEYLLVNFDCYDGNELLANIFHEEYGFCICERFDGIWYKIIRISVDDCSYELMWHEDVGNSIYSINHSDESDNLLEIRLNKVIDIINSRIL